MVNNPYIGRKVRLIVLLPQEHTSKAEERLRENEATSEVRRALNTYAYMSDECKTED